MDDYGHGACVSVSSDGKCGGSHKGRRLKKAGTGKTVKSAKIKWKTSDKAVIKVQKKAGGRAVLSARKKGSATVTAVYQGRKYRCKVAVKKAATKTEDNGKPDGSGGNVPKVHKENGTQTGADKPVLNAEEVSLFYYILRIGICHHLTGKNGA